LICQAFLSGVGPTGIGTKLQTADGERGKRYLYGAIDRASRSVHLAVYDEETEACATAC
jgi:hypothetical protein